MKWWIRELSPGDPNAWQPLPLRIQQGVQAWGWGTSYTGGYVDRTGCHKKITNRILLELGFRAFNYPAVQPTNHFCNSIPLYQVEVNLAIRSMGPVDERREEFTFDCYFRSSVSSFHVVCSICPVWLMLRWYCKPIEVNCKQTILDRPATELQLKCDRRAHHELAGEHWTNTVTKKMHLYRDISFIKVSATRNAVLNLAVSLQDLDSGHLFSKRKGLLPPQDCGAQ